MTRLRTRVRLTARDWHTIASAVAFLSEWHSSKPMTVVAPNAQECQDVLSKIGGDGLDAHVRGVALVRRVKEDRR